MMVAVVFFVSVMYFIVAKIILKMLVFRNGDWYWSDEKKAHIAFVHIVKNSTDIEQQSLDLYPKKLCCMVTDDTLLECGDCSEKLAYICEGFRGEVY